MPRRVREDGQQPVSYTVKSMPVDERPRERLLRSGADSLSDAELLAVVLRTGLPGEMVTEMAKSLLEEHGGFWGLAGKSVEELSLRRGLKGAKVAQLKAVFDIGRRMAERTNGDLRPQVRSPEDAEQLFRFYLAALDQEEMWVLLLDTKNRVIGQPRFVYRGSLNSTSVRVGELFKLAVKENAASVVVAHNHPSGDPAPSPEDIAVTAEIARAGKLLDVDLLDHLIITRNDFRSLKRLGKGFA